MYSLWVTRSRHYAFKVGTHFRSVETPLPLGASHCFKEFGKVSKRILNILTYFFLFAIELMKSHFLQMCVLWLLLLHVSHSGSPYTHMSHLTFQIHYFYILLMFTVLLPTPCIPELFLQDYVGFR